MCYDGDRFAFRTDKGDDVTDVMFAGDPGVVLRDTDWCASGTSDPDESRDRWTEIEIYKLQSGAYVVFGTGRTEIPGEVDRHWMYYCPTATDLIRALLRPTPSRQGGKHLPNYARMALTEASTVDAAVRSELSSWESGARWAR